MRGSWGSFFEKLEKQNGYDSPIIKAETGG
jgi:hypothetical protein